MSKHQYQTIYIGSRFSTKHPRHAKKLGEIKTLCNYIIKDSDPVEKEKMTAKKCLEEMSVGKNWDCQRCRKKLSKIINGE